MHPGGHGLVSVDVFFGWFLCKAKTHKCPSQSCFPWQPAWLSRKQGAACSLGGATQTPPAGPALAAGSECRCGLRAALSSSNETPPGAEGVSGLCPAPFRTNSLWPGHFWGSGRAFSGICSPPEALFGAWGAAHPQWRKKEEGGPWEHCGELAGGFPP